MFQTLKLRDELKRVDLPNGMTFYTDPSNPQLKFFGGGGSSHTLERSQRVLLRDLIGATGHGLTGQGLGGILQDALTPVGSRQVAGFSPLQQQGFGGIGQLSGLGQQAFDIAGQGLQNLGGGFLDTARGALQQGLQGFDPQRITAALEPGRQLALNTFNQDIIPSIMTSLGATSGESGPLNVALADAGRDLALGLGAQAAPFLGQAALAAPGQQLAGSQLAGSLAGLPGDLVNQQLAIGAFGGDIFGQLLNAGGIQQAQTQAQLDAQFAAANQANQLFAQFAPLALGTQAGPSFVGGGGGSGVGAALGSLLGSAGGINTLFGANAAGAGTGAGLLGGFGGPGGLIGGVGSAIGGLGAGIGGALSGLAGLI
jgi:hypothetical protein